MKRYFISHIYVFLVVSLSLVDVVAAAVVDPKTAGEAAGNSVLQQFGTKSSLNQNISIPMTNSGTQMKTIDGSTSFSAAMGVPSSNQFLQVLIQPSGTGDLSAVIVAQDLDSDGNFDHKLDLGVLGVRVSGVCANGLISCTPGTWLACQPYKWVSDNTGALSIVPVPQTQLGGCYCINSSCGSSLAWTNSAIVLKDLGGGAVAAIHAQDASTVITDVKTDMVTITYYGQLLKSAPSANAAVPALATVPAVPQLQAYYGNWPQLSADASSVPLINAGNPDSMYYKMVNSTASQGGVATRKCTVLRNGLLTTVPVSQFTDSGTVSGTCVDTNLWMNIAQTNANTYKLEYIAANGGLADKNRNCGDSQAWNELATVSLPPNTGPSQVTLTRSVFSLTNAGGGGCDNIGTGVINGAFNTAFMTTLSCGDHGEQHPSFDWSYLFEYSTDTYQESVSNGCSVLESDPTCGPPRDEVVDTVVTTRNFNHTGLNPLPTKQTFIGSGAPMDVYRAWWRKDRTYVCTSRQPYDFSAVKQRYNSVVSTSVDAGTALNYTDQRQDTAGNWIAAQSTITLPISSGVSPPDCEQGCKVKHPQADTQAGVTNAGSNTVMSDNRVSNASYVNLYKTCIDGGTTCPVDAAAGETIIENCQCLNEFGQAASVMQLLRLGGADSICSSGTTVAPK